MVGFSAGVYTSDEEMRRCRDVGFERWWLHAVGMVVGRELGGFDGMLTLVIDAVG